MPSVIIAKSHKSHKRTNESAEMIMQQSLLTTTAYYAMLICSRLRRRTCFIIIWFWRRLSNSVQA